jgi:hypothetical protein
LEDNVKKLCIIAALALALVPLSLGAQTAAAENQEFRYLSFDIGYALGWDLDNNARVSPSLFGLNVRLTDKLSTGIQTLTEGANTDKFLLLKYSVLPQVRLTAGFGQNAANDPASSLGFEIIPFSRSVGGVAATEFKLAVKYDAPFNALTDGRILFALGFGIGF